MSAILFETVLRPHCSMSPRLLRRVMTVAACVALAVGGGMALAGARFVVFFMGADLLLLYWALSAGPRALQRRWDRVVLTPASLRVEQVLHGGPPRVVEFPPAWLRVTLEGGAEDGAEDGVEVGPQRCMLASHGRRLEVGAFLSPDARASFAASLNAALQRLRSGGFGP